MSRVTCGLRHNTLTCVTQRDAVSHGAGAGPLPADTCTLHSALHSLAKRLYLGEEVAMTKLPVGYTCTIVQWGTLGFVYRFAAVYGFGKPGKSAAAAAITLTTQGEMCI